MGPKKDHKWLVEPIFEHHVLAVLQYIIMENRPFTETTKASFRNMNHSAISYQRITEMRHSTYEASKMAVITELS